VKYIKNFNESIEINRILKHYNKNIYKNASSNFSKVGWNSSFGQIKRFKIMLDIGVRNNDSIIDYGCGFGDLLKYMKKHAQYKNVKYFGVDINNDFINEAKNKYGDNSFSVIKSYKDINETFDWFLASGVFTVYTSNVDMYKTIDHFYKLVRKGISFNLLNGCDDKDDFSGDLNIRGYDKDRIYTYFKDKYKKVDVIDVFNSYEFNIYIYK